MFEGNAALSAFSISSGYLVVVEFFFLGSFLPFSQFVPFNVFVITAMSLAKLWLYKNLKTWFTFLFSFSKMKLALLKYSIDRGFIISGENYWLKKIIFDPQLVSSLILCGLGALELTPP